ncbi:hypothetical protein RJ639_025502, partial [Escallonia herrerae]
MARLGGDMILGSGTMFVPVPRTSSTRRTSCFASSTINTDHLRTQLEELKLESDNTRAKANNARLRLVRLSEAAERLERQAIISVQTGRKNDARELLFQKKMLMQALEKSKSRIELLDELLAKLNKVLGQQKVKFIRTSLNAISVKETQLVGNVALDLDIFTEEASTPVRIVSPKEAGAQKDDLWANSDAGSLELLESQELQGQETYKEPDNLEACLEVESWRGMDVVSGLKGITSYEDFLQHLDQQLNKIEVELVTVLRFSTLVMDDVEKPKNLKMQQTMEILEDIRRIKGRYCMNQPMLNCKYHTGKSGNQIEIYFNIHGGSEEQFQIFGLYYPQTGAVYHVSSPNDGGMSSTSERLDFATGGHHDNGVQKRDSQSGLITSTYVENVLAQRQ